MNTFIIASKNIKLGSDLALKICKDEKISKFDLTILEFEKTLGIEDVKNALQKIYLRPFKGEKKALIIVLQNGATIEAQNSMLKILEEPPASTLIFLITPVTIYFIPTIISRVKIIELEQELRQTKGALEKIQKTDDFVLAQDLSKQRQDAVSFLEDAILETRSEMVKNLDDIGQSSKNKRRIKKLSQAYYDLKNTNMNSRLALENLFLSL